ncbi:hypothetical protein O1R50_18630 [Glycomyces luteolus]|uniref:Class 3 adenylate cyclase n=1 Tax=Glycomyces luteolus TaxID=2670330 RepID=A0A9X3PDT1_9ACTN|nr:hypothetical protein [Glycomyces luteolus]MDA1361650.1 hypothetical protein [Glycomyces luteolus]
MPASTRREAEDRYLTVLCLDIEQFGRYTDAQSTKIASTFRDVVEQAFERAGLADAYAAHVFMQNAGDGIVAGFDERRLPHIVDRIPAALQFALRELHQQDGLGVRMRMGVSYGPVHGIADRRVDVAPNRTVVDACRVADADPTRLLLQRSDPEATFLAVAVTAPVMDFTVSRNPLWLRKSEFVESDIAIESKHYRTTAFLHVPSPSGALLRSGLVDLGTRRTDKGGQRRPLEERVDREACAAYTLNGENHVADGQANQVGTVGRGARIEQTSTGDVSGDGAIGVVSGTVNYSRDQSTHNTYIAGDQISAGRDATVNNLGLDQFPFGDGKHRRTGKEPRHP